MGFLKRALVPRTVRRALNPVGTIKNAVIPRPINEVRWAVHKVVNPFEAVESAAEGALLSLLRGRRTSLVRVTGARSIYSELDVPDDPVDMVSLTGASNAELAQSSASDLLERIRAAGAAVPLWPIVVAAAVILSVTCIALLWPPLLVVPVAAGVVGALMTKRWDDRRRTVIVFYQLDDAAQRSHERLMSAFGAAAASAKAWQNLEHGALTTTHQRKVNAGASELTKRTACRLVTSGPSFLVTNVPVPSLDVQGRGVYLLPDRILVGSRRTLGEISWATLAVAPSATRFIESDRVPSDGVVIDRTWQFVNKNGPPDRRFSNNRELPVLRYEVLDAVGSNGFRAQWMFSRSGTATELADALNGVARLHK